MSKRKVPFVNNEYYHVYNRGTDKRVVFEDEEDYNRFVQSLISFNTDLPIGSLYEHNERQKHVEGGFQIVNPLVDIIAFCLNPNHFHLILKQNIDGGITRFMQRVGTGYTKYFNEKNKRSGSLYQGKFKARHIDNNEYLLSLSVYVNLNNRIHKITPTESTPVFSSWNEYTTTDLGVSRLFPQPFCKKEIILGQLKNPGDYERHALNYLDKLIDNKELLRGEEE